MFDSLDPSSSPLLIDAYELSMLRCYLKEGLRETAVFEFYVRSAPPERRFLVAAGLEQVLEFLESFRFGEEDLEVLRGMGLASGDELEFLRGLRFTGDVDAMPEGTVFYPPEPILRVTAPLPEAQLLETRVVNLLHYQTLVASKAARCVLAAPGKTLVDFGLRRAHGAEAGLLAARANYLAGFAGTSNVLAAYRWRIPSFGTMAHSLVEAHDDELRAFEAFARSSSGPAVLLLDTYDAAAAARRLPELARRGVRIGGVRLDSGNLDRLSRQVRSILDEGGLRDARIFASGGLDERSLAALVARGAPIDGFGVGTLLDTSADAPFLDAVYKLVEYAGRPRRKTSPGKATLPGRKQVFRRAPRADVLALETEAVDGEPLLVPVMRGGRRVADSGLAEARLRMARELSRLTPAQRGLGPGPNSLVSLSDGLKAVAGT